MDNKQYTKEDILINFKDMLLHILLRWRSILAGVLVLTVLAGGYKYWQDYQYYRARLAASEQAVQTSTKLSEDSLANVGIALNYQKLYRTQVRHNADAPIMKIDAGATPTLTFSAMISGNKGYGAAVLYQSLLNDAATYTAIAEELEWSDPSYTADLVLVDLLQNTAVTLNSGDDYAVLRIRIKAPTETQCRTIETVLRTRLSALKATVVQTAGSHSMTLSGSGFALLVDHSVRSAQQGHINNCNTLKSNLQGVLDKLTDKEKAYIAELNEGEKTPADAKPVINPPSVSKKYLVLGFGGGLVLFVALYGLTYIFGKRIKSKEDLTLRYALSLLGALPGGCKKRRCFVDRWLLRLFAGADNALKPEQAARLLQQQVLLTAQKAGAKTLYVTGCALTQQNEETLQELQKALEPAGIRLQTGPCPLYDAESMQGMASADALLLAETVGVSTYPVIYRELALAKQLDIPVLGAIVLQ